MTAGVDEQELVAVVPDKSPTERRIRALRRGLSIETPVADLPPAKADSHVARIGQSLWFQNVTLCIIVLNALWIAVDIEWNHPNLKLDDGRLPLEPFSTIVDNLFCTFYLAEIIIQMLSFKIIWECVKDKWFVFDAALVSFMVFETWLVPLTLLLIDSGDGGTSILNLGALRIVRLFRITRMIRLMKFVPELFQLAQMIVSACRATSCVLAILLLTIYVWGILFTTFLGTPNGGVPLEGMEDEDPTAAMLFASMGSSMMTLFTNGVLQDNLAQTLTAIKEENLLLLWLFIAFQMLCAFMILNMLIGFICQQVLDVTESNNHTITAHTLTSWFACLFRDIDEGGVLTLENWDRVVKCPKARALLADGDGDVDQRVELIRAALFGKEPRTPDAVAAFLAAHGTQPLGAAPQAAGAAADAADLAACLPRQWSNASRQPEGYAEDEQSRPTLVDRDYVESTLWTLLWDTPASALEVEAYKRYMRRQKRSIQMGIQRIEEKLETFAGMCVKTGTAGACVAPGSTRGPGGRPLAPITASTTRPSPPDFLQKLPSGLLLHVLRLRQPDYSRTKP